MAAVYIFAHTHHKCAITVGPVRPALRSQDELLPAR